MIPHTLISSFVATIPQFSIESCHIMASLLPALKEVRQVGIEPTDIQTRPSFNWSSRGEPSADRAVANSYLLSDPRLTHAELMQSNDLFITGQALFSIRLLKPLHFGRTS